MILYALCGGASTSRGQKESILWKRMRASILFYILKSILLLYFCKRGALAHALVEFFSCFNTFILDMYVCLCMWRIHIRVDVRFCVVRQELCTEASGAQQGMGHDIRICVCVWCAYLFLCKFRGYINLLRFVYPCALCSVFTLSCSHSQMVRRQQHTVWLRRTRRLKCTLTAAAARVYLKALLGLWLKIEISQS